MQFAKKYVLKRDTQRRRQATKKVKMARKRNKMKPQQKDMLKESQGTSYATGI